MKTIFKSIDCDKIDREFNKQKKQKLESDPQPAPRKVSDTDGESCSTEH